jgi:ATP-dependent exoDNAse (exonuclease V) alpha subunit
MPKHLSIRVPWHDNGWNGTVCRHPEYNQACRALKPIALKKIDETECRCNGKPFVVIDGYMPPCLCESGAFMSEKPIDTLPIEHPYTYDEHFNHIAPTPYHTEPYSFTARPYAWTLRKNAKETADKKLYNTHYDDTCEFNTGSHNWVSTGINQKNIFDYFYRNVVPNESMAVAYAKAVPFVETPGRIVIGIGIITAIEKLREYCYTPEYKEGDITAYLWERQIGHSIRNTRENGFLFPFKEIEAYLRDHPEQAPEELIVMAPDGYFNEFSYAAEHLSHDALILTLNRTIEVLQKYQQINLPHGQGEDWAECIRWCKERLDIVWKERGLWPGLGNVLQAVRLHYGQDIADAIRVKISDDVLWDKLPDALNNLADYLPEDMQDIKITKTEYKTWKLMEYDIRLPHLRLLSRINLSLEQAMAALDPRKIFDNRDKPHYADFLSNIKDIESREMLENPYLLYEQTRLFEGKYRFGIGQIDVAMFPSPIIGGEAIVEDPDDERRLRAIIVSILESSAQNGSTLMTADDIVRQVNTFRSDVKLDLDISTMTVMALEDFFKKEISSVTARVEDSEQIAAYQLNRFAADNAVDDVIRKFVQSRVEDDISAEGDWEDYLNAVLKQSKKGEQEDASRTEKLKAIKIMAKSQISVLTGGAGTGKTTTLAALCLSPEIQESGIIILAPTGKARVVLDMKLREADVGCQKAYTIFQFLQKTNHCDCKTYKYYLSGRMNNEITGSTVIIDECSMLTEEMFGALAETLAFAKRVILVGDPNQLPPIGAGKPFFELVEYFKEKHSERFASLVVSNRQKSNTGERLDVELAKLFTYNYYNEVSDDIFSRLSNDNTNIEFVPFDNDASIYGILLKTVSLSAKMTDVNDVVGFDKSLGGVINGEWLRFEDISKIDSWQILSPYRNDSTVGSLTLNRYIHEKYRVNVQLESPKKRRTKRPLGNDGIIYGEKVINIHNSEINGYPPDGCLNYVANGEIGIVEWIWTKGEKTKNNKTVQGNTHQVRFTSQPSHNYNFPSKITDDDSVLELAYALTVHKAQGSGFGTTMLILNEPQNGSNAFISREMIYTALTRQSDKIYILYNKNPSEIQKYSDALFSELTRRLTNLFDIPALCRYNNKFYSDKLIHITRSGERVRSKSEVIIFNELNSAKVPFRYEERLVLKNGHTYSPDFTIYKKDRTVKKYWEHFGMLSNAEYCQKQEKKLADYAENGISEANGNLIITKDELNGRINSLEIAGIVKNLVE